MNKIWWKSLRVKIIAWSFVPTVIILSAVAWFTYYSYQKVIGDLAIKQDWAVVQSKTQPLFQLMYDIVQPIIIPIVLNVDVQKDKPIEARSQNILDHAVGLDIFDGGVYFVNHQGKIVSTYPSQPALLGQDWSDTPHFQFMVDNPARAAYNDLKYIETSGKEILCVSISMNGLQGEFVGAGYYCFTVYPAVQNVYYETYSQAYRDLGLGPNIYMIDGNQRIIFSPDPSEMGRDLSKEEYLQGLLQGQSASGQFPIGKQQVLVSYAPMYAYGSNIVRWNLIKEESWIDVMRPSLPYRQLMLALLALGVVVPVLVTAYGVRHITEPIQKLIRASEQVTAGQFKQRIEVKTGDEIETLADQFNLMSEELDDSYSSLEKKVADRTRELEVMNAIISVASHSLENKEILEEALTKTVEQMGVEAGAAFILDSDQTSPLLVAHQGFGPAFADDLTHSHAISGRWSAAESQSGAAAFAVEDVQDEKLFKRLNQSSFQTLVWVPLSTKGRSWGHFLLAKQDQTPLAPEELSLLTAIGRQIGVALENAHLYEQAEQVAAATERNRLARELHDAVTQTLFSASLIADVLPRIWNRNPEEGLQNLEELRQLTCGALAEMRTLLLEMRPEALEQSEIKTLLTQLTDAFIGRTRIPMDLGIDVDTKLSNEVKIVFYRIAQEALNNIAKHSGAQHVEVHIQCHPEWVNLLIKDDGLGFEPALIPPGQMGMAIMRERSSSIGANLKIESRVGLGTTVELDWRPVHKE